MGSACIPLKLLYGIDRQFPYFPSCPFPQHRQAIQHAHIIPPKERLLGSSPESQQPHVDGFSRLPQRLQD